MNNQDEDDDNDSVESSDANDAESNELTNDFNKATNNYTMSQINTSVNDLEINWNQATKMTFNNIETPILQSYNDLEKTNNSNLNKRVYNLNNLDSTEEFRDNNNDDDYIEQDREEEKEEHERLKFDDEENSNNNDEDVYNCNSNNNNEMNIVDKIIDDDYIDEDFEICNKNSELNIDDENCCQLKLDDYDDNDSNIDNIENNTNFNTDDQQQISDIRCADDINSIDANNINTNKELIIDDDYDDVSNCSNNNNNSYAFDGDCLKNEESKLINHDNCNKIEKQFQQPHQKPIVLNFECLSSIEDNNSQLLEDARIWSDTEALVNQIPQTEASSCGKIAIINVLKALNYEFDYDQLNDTIKFNKRDETGTLAQYLFSRSVAGMNANELIDNVRSVSNNKITGRFFSFYPLRDVNILQWLSSWIKKGAIPVALLNLQRVSIWVRISFFLLSFTLILLVLIN